LSEHHVDQELGDQILESAEHSSSSVRFRNMRLDSSKAW